MSKLKILVEDIEDAKTTIQQRLSKDDIEPAIDKLMNFCDTYKQNEFLHDGILQSASLSRIEKEYRQGTINWEKVNQHRNIIIRNILQIFEKLKSDILKNKYHSIQMVKIGKVLELVNELKANQIKDISINLLTEKIREFSIEHTLKIPLEVIKVIEVEVEIEKMVEVPVEVIKEVEKIDGFIGNEIPLDNLENFTDVPVEIIKEVEKIVEVPVEVIREVEKRVEVPVEIVKRIDVNGKIIEGKETTDLFASLESLLL